MKFLCLAYEEERVLNELSPSEWAALRTETLDYVDELRRTGRLVSAEPLQSARTARTIQVREGRAAVTDGPFAESKEQLGGFFLIEAADIDEAVAVAKRWPSARLGTIEVRPIEDGLKDDQRYH